MRRLAAIISAALLSVTVYAGEQDGRIQFYGFVRTFVAYDSRESVASMGELLYYLPRDVEMAEGGDLNAVGSLRVSALTSRVGFDVTGFSFGGWDMDAKVEADFGAGITGVTGTALLRLRQAYVALSRGGLSFKAGQAWHPMSSGHPDKISLNAGAPFNPLSRTPLFQAEYSFGDLSLELAALWQMQFASAGPDLSTDGGHVYGTGSVTSAEYIKYGKIPEIYLGVCYSADGLLARLGLDLLSIKPRHVSPSGEKLDDRITTLTPFLYLQYDGGALSVKAKSLFAQGGDHVFLNAGYGVTASSARDGRLDENASWEYSPTRSSSTWVSLRYGRELQGVIFAGYLKNFGTREAIVGPDYLYFRKNSFSNMDSARGLSSALIYNLGRLTLGLEYDITEVRYGEWADGECHGLATENLHWVRNHRIQSMVKFTF